MQNEMWFLGATRAARHRGYSVFWGLGLGVVLGRVKCKLHWCTWYTRDIHARESVQCWSMRSSPSPPPPPPPPPPPTKKGKKNQELGIDWVLMSTNVPPYSDISICQIPRPERVCIRNKNFVANHSWQLVFLCFCVVHFFFFFSS